MKAIVSDWAINSLMVITTIKFHQTFDTVQNSIKLSTVRLVICNKTGESSFRR